MSISLLLFHKSAQSSYLKKIYYYDGLDSISTSRSLTETDIDKVDGLDDNQKGASYFNGTSSFKSLEDFDALYNDNFTINVWIKPVTTYVTIFSQYECGSACPSNGSS